MASWKLLDRVLERRDSIHSAADASSLEETVLEELVVFLVCR